MRALAHPTRLALLDHLHAVEQATATECGAVGRERPWRATAARIEFPDGTLEAAVLRDELVARAHAAIRDALDTPAPPEWRRATQTSFATLELTPAELEELGERFEALLDDYRGRGARRSSRGVVVSFQAVAGP